MRRRRRTTALLLALGLAGAGCSSAGSGDAGRTSVASSSTRPATAGPARDAGWRDDLQRIVPGLTSIHPGPFVGASEADLTAAVTALQARVPQSTDDELMVGVMRVVALVSAAGCEGHTGAFVWGGGTYPVDSLPLRLWQFGRDLVVVDALAPYRSLVGSRVDAVEGHPTADVLAAVAPLVPHDNDQSLRLVQTRVVLIPQVLRGLHVARDGPVSLTVSPASAETRQGRTVDVQPVPMATYNKWAGPYGLHLPADDDVPYLSRIDDALWWEVLPGTHTLFVQYNRVDPLPPTQLADLKSALQDPRVTRVVLDLRHNYGGEVSTLPAIESAFSSPTVDRPGKLYVLIGRNTFSAGSLLVARLQRDTRAVLVGEAMGGCPTTWGSPKDLTLPHSGLVISVASQPAVGVDPHDSRRTIAPDVPAALTVREWLDGVDPALAAVRGRA